MTWVKMDDRYPDHPKVAGLTDGAYRLWTTSIAYCSQHQTDGLVPESIITRWGVKHADRAAAELVSGGLWLSSADGYEVANYLNWQRSRSEIEALSSVRSEAGKRGARAKQLAKQPPDKPQAETDTEADPDAVLPPDDDSPLPGDRSSSGSGHPHWSAIAEAGMILARSKVPPPDKGLDAYATKCARNIEREQGHRIAELVSLRPDIDCAGLAAILAGDGAAKAIDRAHTWAELAPIEDLPDFLPASEVTAR